MPGRARAAFPAPESGSGLPSLIFGTDSGAEENASRKTKVTPIPEIARLGAPFYLGLARAGICFVGPALKGRS
jgi:hypothetical protein